MENPKILPELQARAEKDARLYIGIIIEPNGMNMAPDGWEYGVEVTITGLSHVELDDPFLDTYYSVKLTPKGQACLLETEHWEGRAEILKGYIDRGEATPYIRGYTYQLDEDGTPVEAYRGWE